MDDSRRVPAPCRVLPLLAAALAGASWGCSLGGGAGRPNIIFDAARNTAPAIAPAAKGARAVWTVGHPIYSLYSMLQDYDPVASGGGGDLVNLYYVIYTAGQRCIECEEQGIPIPDTVMKSPYDFGRPDAVYDRYMARSSPDDGSPPGTGYTATKKDGDIHYFLVSWIVHAPGLPAEHTVMLGTYDEADGTLVLDLANLGDSDTSKVSARYCVEGNARTHQFSKFLAARWDWFPPGSYPVGGVWYVGTGYSRGSGQKFLFKIAEKYMLPPPGKYFEFPADANETTLQGMDDAGSDTTTLMDYQATVDALVASGAYYDVIPDSPTEVPTSPSSFTGTGDGNMKPVGMP